MSSKAQIAATKEVERLISVAVSDAKHPFMERIYECVEAAQSAIKEYSLSESLVTEGLPKIYDALMKDHHYRDAARFAKKFGL